MKKSPIITVLMTISLAATTYGQSGSQATIYVKACELNVKTNKLESPFVASSKPGDSLKISDLAAGNVLIVQSCGLPVYEKPNLPPANRVILPAGTKLKIISEQPSYIPIPSYENWEWIWVEAVPQL